MFESSWVPSPSDHKSNKRVCSLYKLVVVCTKLACFVQNGHGSYKTFPFSVQSGRGSCKLLTSFVESFEHRKKKLES